MEGIVKNPENNTSALKIIEQQIQSEKNSTPPVWNQNPKFCYPFHSFFLSLPVSNLNPFPVIFCVYTSLYISSIYTHRLLLNVLWAGNGKSSYQMQFKDQVGTGIGLVTKVIESPCSQSWPFQASVSWSCTWGEWVTARVLGSLFSVWETWLQSLVLTASIWGEN